MKKGNSSILYPFHFISFCLKFKQ